MLCALCAELIRWKWFLKSQFSCCYFTYWNCLGIPHNQLSLTRNLFVFFYTCCLMNKFRMISIAGLSKRFRYCHYLGKYFCTSCHQNRMLQIPSKIIDKWDFKQYPCHFIFPSAFITIIWGKRFEFYYRQRISNLVWNAIPFNRLRLNIKWKVDRLVVIG